MGQKYWYRIWRLICDSCGMTIQQERVRVPLEEMATRQIETVPMCEDCYRDMIGV